MNPEPYVHLIAAARGGTEAITAIELVGLGSCTTDVAAGRALERQEEFLGSLVGCQDRRWFEIDYIGHPCLAEPWRSRGRIALLSGCWGETADVARERATALHRGINLALPHDTALYDFADVSSETGFLSLWHPFPARRQLEFARRVDSIPEGGFRLQAFAGFSLEFGGLARALLSASGATRVRFAFRPTRLFPWESLALDRLTGMDHDGSPDEKSLRPLAALSKARDQLLLARVLIESEGETPPGVVAALAADIAGAGHGWSQEPVQVRSGAFDLEPLPIAAPDDLPLPDHDPPSVALGAPDGLERVRHLFSVGQAARLFRLPVLRQPIYGLPSRTSRFLPAPPEVPDVGLLLGRNGSSPGARSIAIPPESRCRHLYALGQTGTGKSTFLYHLIMQDIRAGRGLCLIDPHGDLVEKVMANLPAERVDDVALLDPADINCPAGLNPLDVADAEERELISEQFIALFERLWPPEFVGPIFQNQVRNTIKLILHLGEMGVIPNPPSILMLPRFMQDRKLLTAIQQRVRDPLLKSFVNQALAQDARWRGETIEHVLSKFNVLLGHASVANIVGQRKNRLDIERAVEEGKILLVRLPSGQLGEVTAKLLGFLVLAKVQNVILGRAEKPRDQRQDYYLYVDEFQNFLSESFTILLAEGRKFGVNMVIANQFLRQLEDDKIRHRLLGAIFGNVGTIVAFRVGQEDAQDMALQFGNSVETQDLTTLANFHAYARVLSGEGTPVSISLRAAPATKDDSPGRAEACRRGSRQRHGTPVKEVREDIEFQNLWLDALANSLPPPREEPGPSTAVLDIPPVLWSWLKIYGIGYVDQLKRVGFDDLAKKAVLTAEDVKALRLALETSEPTE